MIDNLRVLALITARGGSKRLPGKNIRTFAGKPLIAWTVLAARQSRYIDRIVVSSDAAEIISAAVQVGAEAPFIRPIELSADSSTSVDVALHALNALEEKYDLLLLLQPTSPLRNVSDIDLSLRLSADKGLPVASVSTPFQAPKDFHLIDGEGLIRDFPCAHHKASQGIGQPGAVCTTGAIYVVHTDVFRRELSFAGPGTLAYFMPPERSIDIDTELDFKLAEFLHLQRSRS